jgi:hypothetical protein
MCAVRVPGHETLIKEQSQYVSPRYSSSAFPSRGKERALTFFIPFGVTDGCCYVVASEPEANGGLKLQQPVTRPKLQGGLSWLMKPLSLG